MICAKPYNAKRNSIQVMVANVRCEEIMLDKLNLVRESEQWLVLKEKAASQLVPDFGSQAHTILESCLAGELVLMSFSC